MRLTLRAVAMDDNQPRMVPCPSCRKPALFGEKNPWRPFCSQRCRNVDLGAWASEQFRVPAEAPTAMPSDDNSVAPGH